MFKWLNYKALLGLSDQGSFLLDIKDISTIGVLVGKLKDEWVCQWRPGLEMRWG